MQRKEDPDRISSLKTLYVVVQLISQEQLQKIRSVRIVTVFTELKLSSGSNSMVNGFYVG